MCTVSNLNGTRCRDGVKVLWCHSHLVFRVPSPHVLISFRKLFVTCLCCFSLYCCLGIVREKRWEGRLRGRVRVRVRVRAGPKIGG